MRQQYEIGELPALPGARVAILQAQWHRALTDVMVRRCREVLARAQITEVTVHLLPGSLELPFAAQDLAERDPGLAALIAFGIIVKGETDHYEAVRDECFRGLGAVSRACRIPVINEVLPVRDIRHAEARCADTGSNKGIEAALAAIGTIAWRRSSRIGASV